MEFEELEALLAGKVVPPVRPPMPDPVRPPMPDPVGAPSVRNAPLGQSTSTLIPEQKDEQGFWDQFIELVFGSQGELGRGQAELAVEAASYMPVVESGAELAGGFSGIELGNAALAEPLMQANLIDVIQDKIRDWTGRNDEVPYSASGMPGDRGAGLTPNEIFDYEKILSELPKPGAKTKDAWEAFNKVFEANPDLSFPEKFELSKNAAQDSAGPMPTGYWVASGLIAEELFILATFGAGRGLQATRVAAGVPRVLEIAGAKIPQAARPFMQQAANAAGTTLKVVEGTLKAPYRAEEAVGKAVGFVARAAGRNLGRTISPEPFKGFDTGSQAATVIDVPDDFVPYDVMTANAITEAEERAAREVIRTRAAVENTRAEARGAGVAAEFEGSQQAARDANRAREIDALEASARSLTSALDSPLRNDPLVGPGLQSELDDVNARLGAYGKGIIPGPQEAPTRGQPTPSRGRETRLGLSRVGQLDEGNIDEVNAWVKGLESAKRRAPSDPREPGGRLPQPREAGPRRVSETDMRFGINPTDTKKTIQGEINRLTAIRDNLSATGARQQREDALQGLLSPKDPVIPRADQPIPSDVSGIDPRFRPEQVTGPLDPGRAQDPFFVSRERSIRETQEAAQREQDAWAKGQARLPGTPWEGRTWVPGRARPPIAPDGSPVAAVADDVIAPARAATFEADPNTPGVSRRAPELEVAVDPETGTPLLSSDPRSLFSKSPSLNRRSKVVNVFNALRDSVLLRTGDTRGRRRVAGVEGIAETAKRDKARVTQAVSSMAEVVAARIRSSGRVFRVNKDGLITDPALQNQVIQHEGQAYRLVSPTIQDVAARLDTYRPFLTNEQLEFMEYLKGVFETGSTDPASEMPGWNQILRESLDDWPEGRVRPDIEEGGFFITRGMLLNSRKDTSIFEEIENLIKQASEATGPMGAQRRAEMPAMGQLQDVEGKLILRQGYEPLATTSTRYINGVGAKVNESKIVSTVRANISESPTARPIGANKSTIPYMSDVSLDDPLAAAFERAFGQGIRPDPLGTGAIPKGLEWAAKSGYMGARYLNNFYRSLKSNFDLSALFIHGRIAVYRHPLAWGQAGKVMLEALFQGDPAFGQWMRNKYDAGNADLNLPGSEFAASRGLFIGGTAQEYAFPGVAGLGKLGAPGRAAGSVIDTVTGRVNLAFGTFGDAIRLMWWREQLIQELSVQRTRSVNPRTWVSPQEARPAIPDALRQLDESGALREMADNANRLTGWTANGGLIEDLGQLLLFAPRFFVSRLEVLAKTIEGAARPGLALVPGTNVRARTRETDEALRSVLQMMGLGMAMVEAINLKLGNETDRDPIVNGKLNPNFYVINYGGRDYSPFGPDLSLVRAIAVLMNPNGTPKDNVAEAYRSLQSGSSRIIWDAMTGYQAFGEEAPLGAFREDPAIGRVSSPGVFAEYILDLVMPITPGQIAEDVGEEMSRSERGMSTPETITSAVIGNILTVGGLKVTAESITDVRQQIAKEQHDGASWESLSKTIRDSIDQQVRDRLPDMDKYRGPEGRFYKKRDDTNSTLIDTTNTIEKDLFSTNYEEVRTNAPDQAYNEYAEAKTIHRKTLNGVWSPNSTKYVDGVYQNLYGDGDPEPAEKGDVNYYAWLVNQTYDLATSASVGGSEPEIDWELQGRLVARVWETIPAELVSTVFDNYSSRVLESKYSPEMKNLLAARRYANTFSQELQGEVTNFFDLEEHPTIRNQITQKTGLSDAAVLNYFRMASKDKNREKDIRGSDVYNIRNALRSLRGPNGLLKQYEEQFINKAPDSWKQGMYEGGYGDRVEQIMTVVKNQVRSGRELGSLNYEALFFEALKPGAARPGSSFDRQGENLVEWPSIEREPVDNVSTWMPTGLYGR